MMGESKIPVSYPVLAIASCLVHFARGDSFHNPHLNFQKMQIATQGPGLVT